MSAIYNDHRDEMFADIEWTAKYLGLYGHAWYVHIRIPSTFSQGSMTLEQRIQEAEYGYRERSHTIRKR